MLVVVTGSLLTMALLPNVTEPANILAAPITDTAGLELNIAPVRDALITDPELALVSYISTKIVCLKNFGALS